MNLDNYTITDMIINHLTIRECIVFSRTNKNINKIAHPDSQIWLRKLPIGVACKHVHIKLLFPYYFYNKRIFVYKINIDEVITTLGHKLKWVIYKYYKVKDKKNFYNDLTTFITIGNCWHNLLPIYEMCKKNQTYLNSEEQYWVRRNTLRWLRTTDLIRPYSSSEKK